MEAIILLFKWPRLPLRGEGTRLIPSQRSSAPLIAAVTHCSTTLCHLWHFMHTKKEKKGEIKAKNKKKREREILLWKMRAQRNSFGAVRAAAALPHGAVSCWGTSCPYLFTWAPSISAFQRRKERERSGVHPLCAK